MWKKHRKKGRRKFQKKERKKIWKKDGEKEKWKFKKKERQKITWAEKTKNQEEAAKDSWTLLFLRGSKRRYRVACISLGSFPKQPVQSFLTTSEESRQHRKSVNKILRGSMPANKTNNSMSYMKSSTSRWTCSLQNTTNIFKNEICNFWHFQQWIFHEDTNVWRRLVNGGKTC